MRAIVKKADSLKYIVLIFIFTLIFVRLFNVFIYPSFEIISALLILGTCLVGIILIWIDEAIGREELYKMHETLKQKQAELIQSGKLAAVGSLASGVAHELNNPLTGIVGSAEIILKRSRKAERDCDDCYRVLETVKKEGSRCQDLARNLLNFSRKRKADMKPIDLNQVVEDTFKILSYHISRPGGRVEVIKNLGRDLPKVSADADQLEQVVMNLIINGYDAMPQGGTVTISTSFRGGKIYLEVSDTGAGIPEELKSRIFEPLFTTKAEGKGTGLGLSVTMDIVRSHRGDVYFKSKPGEGTLFTVVLPAYENH